MADLRVRRKSRCPLRVRSGHFATQSPCPLYPRKRTCAVQSPMSARPIADTAISRQESVTDRWAKFIALKKTAALRKKESYRGPVPTGCDCCRAAPQTEHRVFPPPSLGQDRSES